MWSPSQQSMSILFWYVRGNCQTTRKIILNRNSKRHNMQDHTGNICLKLRLFHKDESLEPEFSLCVIHELWSYYVHIFWDIERSTELPWASWIANVSVKSWAVFAQALSTASPPSSHPLRVFTSSAGKERLLLLSHLVPHLLPHHRHQQSLAAIGPHHDDHRSHTGDGCLQYGEQWECGGCGQSWPPAGQVGSCRHTQHVIWLPIN